MQEEDVVVPGAFATGPLSNPAVQPNVDGVEPELNEDVAPIADEEPDVVLEVEEEEVEVDEEVVLEDGVDLLEETPVEIEIEKE